MRRAAAICVALGLTACGQVGSDARAPEAGAEYGYAEADLAPAPVAARKAAPELSEPSDPSGLYLAYRYGYGLELPASAVKPTADKHMRACQEAGPDQCQVMGSSANSYSEENVQAQLSLRAAPDWLSGFVAEMKSDVAEAEGRLTYDTTSVQDLTRSILDTDARLKAQTTLRGRLENLLETRDAELSDLLALERELARVQGEIESATANLKALRARVSMSVVDINYTSENVAVSRSALSPIGAALTDFVGIVADGLSGVIRFFAVLLPWLVFVILPGLFLLRWMWRRRKTRA